MFKLNGDNPVIPAGLKMATHTLIIAPIQKIIVLVPAGAIALSSVQTLTIGTATGTEEWLTPSWILNLGIELNYWRNFHATDLITYGNPAMTVHPFTTKVGVKL
jgi:hypothetical protein